MYDCFETQDTTSHHIMWYVSLHSHSVVVHPRAVHWCRRIICRLKITGHCYPNQYWWPHHVTLWQLIELWLPKVHLNIYCALIKIKNVWPLYMTCNIQCPQMIECLEITNLIMCCNRIIKEIITASIMSKQYSCIKYFRFYFSQSLSVH